MQSKSGPPPPFFPSTSSTTKRKISTFERSISPPALKRKRPVSRDGISATSSTSASALTPRFSEVSHASSREVVEKSGDDEKRREEVGMRDKSTEINILSWNVNGLTHLLHKSMRTITSFFSTTFSRKKRDGELYDSEDERMEQEEGRRGNGIPPMRGFLKRHHWPHIVCPQEVKIAPSEKERMEKALEKAANFEEDGRGNETVGPKYYVILSLPRDQYNAKGFGGRVHGVCSLVRKDLECCGGIPEKAMEAKKRVTTKGVEWDLEGRVLITEIINQDSTGDSERRRESLVGCWKLEVINGYWPNGTTNPYRSPTTGEISGTRRDFKRSFYKRMLTQVQTYQKDGWHVFLIGDMNIAPQRIDGFPNLRLGVEHVRNREDFNRKFLSGDNPNGMGGVDTFRWIRGQLKKYSYHGERADQWGMSCDRVDLGIVSRGVVERDALVNADILETVEERGGSDHVPIGVVIDVEKLARVSRLGEAVSDLQIGKV
ncbi:uncharacterized protein BP5553_03750 [Venustampulla echinocandica]|uniref:DNase I-like protein n=1 Tax=Venustampulla echinocandica TaxID=2656787 RepID=A0A370TV79_9HELO|nr:uncharacterized protein BP5553_03750 [Venustampulla echinocandica]RDL39410.1 hypothetical protein BP5553_03750 [Venustampulla echinocandica]